MLNAYIYIYIYIYINDNNIKYRKVIIDNKGITEA